MYDLMTVDNNMSEASLSAAADGLLLGTPSLTKIVNIGNDDGPPYTTGIGSRLGFRKDTTSDQLLVRCDDGYIPDAGELAAITAALDTGGD